MRPVPLTLRQRASWLAHLFKASTQQHHEELRPLLASHIPVDAVVVDIGAHAGQFTKLFARMAPKGHVYAFEPSAYARSILGPAVRFNRLRNVTIVPLGLSDAPAKSVLHTPLKRRASLGFGIAHLGATAAGQRAMDQTVCLMTLDDFVEERRVERLDFVKADIEGWELRALEGGSATLRRFRPALLLEVDARFLARAGDTPQALFAWLGELGYAGVTVPGLAPAPSFAGVGDYLFAAPSKA
jgi:FkbM family methyltransferase